MLDWRSQSRGTGLSLSLRSSAGMRFGSARTVPAASLYNFCYFLAYVDQSPLDL